VVMRTNSSFFSSFLSFRFETYSHLHNTRNASHHNHSDSAYHTAIYLEHFKHYILYTLGSLQNIFANETSISTTTSNNNTTSANYKQAKKSKMLPLIPVMLLAYAALYIFT
jgi:hypothetical protein